MRQTGALGVAWRFIQVKAERSAFDQHDRAVSKNAYAQLGALQVGQDADGTAGFLLQFAQHRKAGAVVVGAAVAEVQPKHVDAGHEQPANDVFVGAGGAKGRHNFGISGSAHFLVLGRCVDEDGAKVVHIGQRGAGDDRVPQRLEKAVAIVVGQAVFGPQAQRPGAV